MGLKEIALGLILATRVIGGELPADLETHIDAASIQYIKQDPIFYLHNLNISSSPVEMAVDYHLKAASKKKRNWKELWDALHAQEHFNHIRGHIVRSCETLPPKNDPTYSAVRNVMKSSYNSALQFPDICYFRNLGECKQVDESYSELMDQLK